MAHQLPDRLTLKHLIGIGIAFHLCMMKKQFISKLVIKCGFSVALSALKLSVMLSIAFIGNAYANANSVQLLATKQTSQSPIKSTTKVTTSVKTNARASETTSKTNPKTNSLTAKSSKNLTPDYRFSGSLDLGHSTGLIDFKDGSRSDTSSVGVGLSLKTPVGTYSYGQSFSQDLRDSESIYDGVSNGSVSYVYKTYSSNLSDTHNIRWSPRVSLTIPMSDYSTKVDQLQTALSISLSASLEPKNNAADEGQFILSSNVSLGRNFHKYEENRAGKVLNQYSSSQGVTLGYSINKFNMSLNLSNISVWSYQNNPRNTYEISETISYQINNTFSAALGHSNSGSPLKANGQDYEVKVIDENTSTVFTSLGVAF